MKRAALYVRVSTQEQAKHGLSVDNQIEALKQYCQDNGLMVYRIYNDAGISGHASYKKRPALLELIADCKARNVDVILFTRIDRWFRSIKDYYLVMEQIGDMPWKAIWEDYETETSAGQFKVNIMLSVAEAEASRTSEKIKSVFEYKKERGEYIGTVPYGFKVVDKKLVVDEDAAPTIHLMFDTYFRTWSTKETFLALDAAGHHTPKDTVRKRLRSDYFVGPYITKEQHDQIIDAMAKYVRAPKDPSYHYIFAGIARCGYCGCRLKPLTSHYSRKSGEKVRKVYYHCLGQYGKITHPVSVNIKEKELEDQMLELIETALDQLNAERNSRREKPAADPQKLEAKLQRIGIRFEDGDISLEEYRAKRAEIMEQIQAIKMIEQNTKPILLPENWRSMYDGLDNLNRRAFWRSFISEIKITAENKNCLSREDLVFLTYTA